MKDLRVVMVGVKMLKELVWYGMYGERREIYRGKKEAGACGLWGQRTDRRFLLGSCVAKPFGFSLHLLGALTRTTWFL